VPCADHKILLSNQSTDFDQRSVSAWPPLAEASYPHKCRLTGGRGWVWT